MCVSTQTQTASSCSSNLKSALPQYFHLKICLFSCVSMFLPVKKPSLPLETHTSPSRLTGAATPLHRTEDLEESSDPQ